MLNRILWAVFAVAVFAVPAEMCLARLGETEAELEARYGKPGLEDTKPLDAAPADKRVWFNKDGVLVGAIIFRGRCVGVGYGFSDQDGGKTTVTAQMAKAKVLLEANAQGATWKEKLPELVNPGMEYLWERSDGKAFAVVWKRSAATLQIMDASFVNESANSDKQSEAGLKGF